MRTSISNIAWDASYDARVSQLLKRYKIDAIDIAPGRYFDASMTPSDREISDVRNFWTKNGIQIVGMQSLLYGTHGLNLFGTVSVQDQMIDHLKKVSRIARLLGVRFMTFGSPKNRDCLGLNYDDALNRCKSFFLKLLSETDKDETVICLEPNPVSYGCNFATTTLEAAKIVQFINHPRIKLQLDTGALIMNKEDFESEFSLYSYLVSHIHISDENLDPLGVNISAHQQISSKIKEAFVNPVLTIEMLTHKLNEPLSSIERAIQFTQKVYG